MLILKIASKPHFGDDYLAENGVRIQNVAPSTFSFFTSVRIASFCKATKPDAIFVYTLNDAMAAISARGIDKDNSEGTVPYPIVLIVSADTPVPRKINRQIATNLSAVVFDSEITKRSWENVPNQTSIKLSEVLKPFGHVAPEITKARKETEKAILTFFGSIGEGTTLKRIIDAISSQNLEDRIKVRVLGTGRAQYVMPIVKRARANKLDVDWLGETFDLSKEEAIADGFIAGGPTFTPEELRFLANGIPAIDADRLSDFTDESKRCEMSAQAIRLYNENFTPEAHIMSLKKLIDRLQ